MKTYIFILTLVALQLFGIQQRIVEERVKCSTDDDVQLDFKFADIIKINVWEKNELYVKASVSIDKDNYNDAFFLESNTTGNKIVMNGDIRNLEELSRNKITIGENGEAISQTCFETDIEFEVFVPKVKTLSINTISGNIEIAGYTGEMALKTISGFVDISVPESHKANLNCKTITGAIYTDLEKSMELNQTEPQMIGSSIKNKLNGGGKDILLETISGDIYIRKSK